MPNSTELIYLRRIKGLRFSTLLMWRVRLLSCVHRFTLNGLSANTDYQ